MLLPLLALDAISYHDHKRASRPDDYSHLLVISNQTDNRGRYISFHLVMNVRLQAPGAFYQAVERTKQALVDYAPEDSEFHILKETTPTNDFNQAFGHHQIHLNHLCRYTHLQDFIQALNTCEALPQPSLPVVY